MLIILASVIPKNEKENHQSSKISHIPSLPHKLQGMALKRFLFLICKFFSIVKYFLLKMARKTLNLIYWVF